MELVVRPHIMSDRGRSTRDVGYGDTIQQLVDSVEDIDPRVKELNLAVFIDGVAIPRSAWGVRTLSKSDHKVEVAAVLQGGGGGGQGKQILALIATVLLSIFAGPVAGMLTAEGGLLAGASTLLVKAGIMLVGTLAINAIFAPPKAKNDGESGGNAYNFGNQSNRARQFGRVPRVYGKHRVVPDIAAMPYTINVGDEQFMYVVYSFGYGPLKLEDFRIGQNPLTNYKEYEIKVHESFTDPDDLEIYRSDVWQDSLNLELKKDDGPTVITSRADVDRVIVDMTFPAGLGYANESGEVEQRSAEMLIEYRAHGSTGPWLPVKMVDVSKGKNAPVAEGRLTPVEIIHPDYAGMGGPEHVTYGLPAGEDTFAVTYWEDGVPNIGARVNIAQFYGESARIVAAGTNATTLVITEPLEVEIPTPDGQMYFTYDSPIEPDSGKWVITDDRSTSFNASVSMIFPTKGQWSIRFTKLDDDFDEENTKDLWRRFITAVKSLKSVPPLNPEVPITIVELKIKASGQLNGSIETFSAIATSRLRYWNGSAWVVGETRNPAWIYLDVLTGSANLRPVADARIDMDAIKAWAVKCDTITSPFTQVLGTCDVVIDRNMTVWELLQSIATTGRATPTIKDNKYSILIDDATRTPVQMFTPRNSSNLKSTRTYVQEPHGLRVKWIDPESGWGPAEIIVYNTGYNESTATFFEDLQSFGMTRPEQVTRWGRYMLAQGKLRQERFTLQADVENIICVRGDLVLVAHDVIEVGGDASRIVEVDGSTLYFDAPVTMEEGLAASSAGVRIRKSNGTFTGVLDVSAYGVDGEGNYYATISGSLAGVAAGDLAAFGLKTQVVGEYVVDYVRPNDDLGATIGLEEYAPAVYTAESTGVLPPYTPQGGGSFVAAAPVDFTIELIEYKESSVGDPTGELKLTWNPSQDVPFQPASYRIWQVNYDKSERYIGEVNALSYTDGPLDLKTLSGQVRTYRLRAFYGSKGVSDAVDATYTMPARTPAPPLNVDEFDVESLANGMRRYTWAYDDGVLPMNFAGVDIRYVAGTTSTPTWSTMSRLTNPGLVTTTGLEVGLPTGEGAFTFAIRAVDTFGTRSTDMLVINRTLGLSSIDGGSATDPTPPPTPTNFTGTAGINSVFFEHDEPTYTVGGGHSHTKIYYAIYPGTGPEPVFADAEPFGTFQSYMGSMAAEPGTKYHFWAVWVSKAGVESATPAPVGPANGLELETGVDVAKLLAILTGEITATQLYADLGARIDLIDAAAGVPGSVNARVASEASTRQSADTALANDISQVTTTVNGHTTTISTHTSSINGLHGQYTVKIDNNSYVTGFGLASTPVNGTPFSSFAVRSDSFYIASPSGPGVSPSMPFIVRTTGTTIGGEFVPVGVYMTDAFIQNGTITTAKMADLTVTNAKVANLAVTTAKIVDANITTLKVAGNNVTVPVGADGFNGSTLGYNQSVSFSVGNMTLQTSGVVQFTVNWSTINSSGSDSDSWVIITINGTDVFAKGDTSASFSHQSHVATFSTTVGAGTHSLGFRLTNLGTSGAPSASHQIGAWGMNAIGLQR